MAFVSLSSIHTWGEFPTWEYSTERYSNVVEEHAVVSRFRLSIVLAAQEGAIDL